jgi:hypothetical protein
MQKMSSGLHDNATLLLADLNVRVLAIRLSVFSRSIHSL